MRRGYLTFSLVLLACSAIGCRGVGTPDLFDPGSAKEQVRRAQRFDVYPEQETGPTVDGGRAPGMDKPWPEPTRARWHNGRPT